MNDIRLGDIIRSGEDGDVVLLGFPRDEGVEINGGRVGARQGPEKFRFWIRRFGTVANPEMEVDLSRLSITDAGDIPPKGSLEKAHKVLSAKIASILKAGGIPFVVGGGNDQSYPNASALLAHCASGCVGVINIDAHLDVRPLKDNRAHSGSSFRQLLEDSRFRGEHFIEFAAQGSQCSREHTDYILRRKGRILWLNEIRGKDHVAGTFRESLGKLGWDCTSIFVSFDLDSVAISDAPGVSCPGILGLNAGEAVSIAYQAGIHPLVSLFDLSEYNPVIEEERTGKLAAAIFYNFCLGVAARKEKGG